MDYVGFDLSNRGLNLISILAYEQIWQSNCSLLFMDFYIQELQGAFKPF